MTIEKFIPTGPLSEFVDAVRPALGTKFIENLARVVAISPRLESVTSFQNTIGIFRSI